MAYKYKFLYGPKTGQVEEFKPGPQLETLKAAGLIELLPDPPPLPPKTTWLLLATRPFSDTLTDTTRTPARHVKVSCDTCGQMFSIYNPTKNFVFAHCGVREHIPDGILKEGRKEWEEDAKSRAEIASIEANRVPLTRNGSVATLPLYPSRGPGPLPAGCS